MVEIRCQFLENHDKKEQTFTYQILFQKNVFTCLRWSSEKFLFQFFNQFDMNRSIDISTQHIIAIVLREQFVFFSISVIYTEKQSDLAIMKHRYNLILEYCNLISRQIRIEVNNKTPAKHRDIFRPSPTQP